MDGLHVLEVKRDCDRLTVNMESAPTVMGCPAWEVVAASRGRREAHLVEAPCFGGPVWGGVAQADVDLP